MKKSTNLRFSASLFLVTSFFFPAGGVVHAKTPAAIHEIQGSFFSSQMIDEEVESSGIVTSLYISTKGLEGFYIQAPKNEEDSDIRTAEAIYVKLKTAIPTASNTLKEGHKVMISGKVEELPSVTFKGSSDSELTTTAISNAEIMSTTAGDFLPDVSVVTLGKDRKIPSIVSDASITDALTPEKYSLDYFEALEAMRVRVDDSQLTAVPAQDTYSTIIEENNQSVNGGVVATPAQPFGNLVYLQVPHRFSNKGSKSDPNRMKGETGDILKGSLYGVVTYNYGAPKIYLDYNQFDAKTNTFASDKITIQVRGNKREVADFKSEAGAPTIAEYNIENFSANPKTTSDEHVEGISDDIINHLFLPDIINLCEVQDNDGESNTSIVDASQSIKRLTDAIMKKSGIQYQSLSVDPKYNEDGGAPNANIRVVHLYNPNRVTPLAPTVTQPTTEILNTDGTLTTNPTRLGVDSPFFQATRKPLVSQFLVDGKKLTVIGNHLSSKRGDSSIYGNTQPPVLKSEENRVEQAKLVNQFVKLLQQKDKDANIVVLGDFNDYEFSKPLTALKGTELVNMIEKLDQNTRYSYNYSGREQTLDHILLSNNLGDSKVDAVHINADFRPDNGSHSDHDPIVVQLKFPAPLPAPMGTITITKQDKADGTKLAGAIYEVRDVKGVVVDTLITDAAGNATTVSLPLGDYALVETVSPKGYELDATPVTVTITTDGQVISKMMMSTKTPVIVPVAKGIIEITIQDKADGTKLKDAEFDVKDAKGVIVDHVVTDATGKAKTKALPLGDYTFVETKAPAGYELDATPVTVTITTDGQVISKMMMSTKTPIIVPVATGSLEIVMQDKADGTKLKDAEFDVKDAKGVIVDHVVTDAAGKAKTKALPLGNYTFVETKAPAGYELDVTPIKVVLTTNGQIISKMMMSTKTPVIVPVATGVLEIVMQDKADGTKLKDAEFDVKDAKGVIVDHVVTDAAGKAKTKALPLGEYTFVETKAPAGYELDVTPIKVVLTTTGQIISKMIESMKLTTPIVPTTPTTPNVAPDKKETIKPATTQNKTMTETALPDTSDQNSVVFILVAASVAILGMFVLLFKRWHR